MYTPGRIAPMEPPSPADTIVRFGVFQLDRQTRQLLKQGRRIPLQDKPFEILCALVERPGEILTREDLRRRLWPGDTFVVFDDSLNTAIRKLREALADSAQAPRFIETIPRHGYRFIGEIRQTVGVLDAAPLAAASRPASMSADPILSHGPTGAQRATQRMSAATVAVTIAAVAGLVATIWRVGEAPASSPNSDVMQFRIVAPEGTRFPAGDPRLALSPDGRQLAFLAVSVSDGIRRLWLHSLDTSSATPLANTDNAWEPLWSPDGKAVAFVSYGILRRLDLGTGAVTTLAHTDTGTAGAWHLGSGLLVPRPNQGLLHLSPGTSEARAITTLDATRDEIQHAYPQFVSDDSFLYSARSRRPELNAVYLGYLDGRAPVRVLETCCRATFVNPDILVFVDGQRLIAKRFDSRRGTLNGEAVQIASGVAAAPVTGSAAFSLSAGALAYAGPPKLPQRELAWFTRAGVRLAGVTTADHDIGLELSDDGAWVMVERPDPHSPTRAPDLWLIDMARGVRSQVTHSHANDESPVWAADSRRFAYARHRAIHGIADLYVVDRTKPDQPQPLLVDEVGSKHPSDWSRDGRFLLYDAERTDGKRDVWVLPFTGGRAGKPYRLLASAADEARARFSPDGRFVAYESSQTGRSEIFVSDFTDPATKWQISSTGGTQVRWRGDGRELYYVNHGFQLMAVALPEKKTFTADAPRSLFELRRLTAQPLNPTPFTAAGDGQRFLIGTVVDEGSDAPIHLVLNWRKLLN